MRRAASSASSIVSSPAGLEPTAVEPAPQPGVDWPELSQEPASARAARAPAGPTLPPLGTNAKLSLGLAVVLVLTALLAKGGTSLGPMTLVEVGLTLIGAGVAAAAVLAAPTPARPWGRVTLLALAALTAWTALSVIWSITPDISWQDANLAIAYLAAFAGGIGLARLFPWQAGNVLAGVLLASIAVCVIALAIKAFPVVFNSTEELARLREPIDYWNALGLLAAFAVPPALWLGARREGPPALRALGPPLVGLALVVVLLSYSRGVLIALTVGLAFWFAFVPLRLRGVVVGLAGAAGGAAVGVWAFAEDALAEDRAPLAQRVSAGEDLAVYCLLMVAVLYFGALAVNRYGDRRPLSPRWRGRLGLGVAGAAVVALLAGVVALSLTGGGPVDRVDRAWDNFFSTTKASTTYGPERLKSIGTRRGSYWREAEDVWSADKVLGAGAGGYAVARKRYRRDPIEVQHAHGYVPQTAADLGIVGVLLSLLFAIALAVAAARTLSARGGLRAAHLDPRRLARAPAAAARAGQRLARVPATVLARSRSAPSGPVDRDRIALATLLAVVITFAVHSLIDWTWMVPGTALVALVCAGFLAGRGPAGVPGPERTQPFGGRLFVACGLLLAALVGTWAIWQPLRSERASDAALAALESGRPNDARVEALEAHDRNPLALRPLQELSSIEDAAGRRDQAQKALEEAVKLQPSNPASWTALAAYQLNVLNQPSVAFQSARAALFLDPKSASAQALFLDAYRKLPRRPVNPSDARRKSPGDRIADEIQRLGRSGASGK
jgi:tetratricopeptide (TPR) repeat protein